MDTKICTWCHQELPLSEFPIRDSAKGTYRANCKKCHSEYMKKKYREKKDALHEYKQELSCQKCGYNKCGAALEFHHLNSDKKDEKVSRLIANRYSLDNPDIQNEIAKCIVLCANCHHELHFLLNNKKISSIEEFLSQE